MDFDHPEHLLDRLLDHGQLVRSLASALVHGPADVDDVVQGTFAAALTTKRPAGFPLPRWLLGVARNLARRSHRERRRRTQRELQAARPEALRSTAEVVELEELRRLVVAAVLGLDEPYRSAVLLRYYDGLPPREIARRLGVPAATVRSHLHRALGQLQQRLDRDWRGGRAAWAALLLPLAPVPVLPTKGTVTMTSKIILGTALVAATALLWQTLRTPVVANEQTVATVPDVPRPTPHAATLADPAVRTDAAAQPVASEPAATMPFASLRFVDATGAAITGRDLQERFASSRTQPTALLLDADALERGGIEGMIATRFGDPAAWQQSRSLVLVAGGAEVRDLPGSGRFHLLIARPSAPAHLTAPFALPAPATLAFDVPTPGADSGHTVRVVAAEDGAPLLGARLRAYTEFGDDRAFVPGTTVLADAHGEAILTDEEPKNPLLIRPAIWWVETDDRAARLDRGVEMRVPLRGRVMGSAVRSDAAPATGWTVAFASDKGPRQSAAVDDQGRFQLDHVAAGRGMLALLGKTEADLRTKGLGVDPGATKTFDFAAAAKGAQVLGRITAGGRPLAGVLVMAAAGRSERRFVKTDENGAYRVDSVANEARFLVMLGDPDVSDDFVILRNTPIELQPGTPATFDFDLPRGCCPVRVLDEVSGEPLAGVPVEARPAMDKVQQDRFPGFEFRAGWAARTDARGEVLLRALPEGEPHLVRVGGHGFTTATTGLRAPARDENVERIVVRVRRS